MANVKVYEPASGTVIETVDNGSGAQRQIVAAHVLTSGAEVTSTNRLPVDVGNLSVQQLTVQFPNSVVSTLNSTTTPLGANLSFTGGWEDVTKFSAVSVVGMTDQASALNGAVVEFSADGTNVVRSIAATVPANTGLTFMFSPEARYFRIVYTNGSVAQTSLTLQAILHYQMPTAPQLPLAATTSDVSLAEATLAHLKGRLANGVWQAVQLTNAGAVVVDGSGVVQPVSGTVNIGTMPNISGTVTVSNPTANPETGLAKDATLTSGSQKTQVTNFPAVQTVTDFYTTLETLADQSGAGAVLTFTFTSTPKLIVVLSKGAVSRAQVGTATPTATNGVYCDDGVPSYVPVQNQTVKVYAPTGATVSVWGLS